MNTIAIPSLGRSSFRSERVLYSPFSPLRVLLAVLSSIILLGLVYGFSAFVDLVRNWAAFNVGMHLMQ